MAMEKYNNRWMAREEPNNQGWNRIATVAIPSLDFEILFPLNWKKRKRNMEMRGEFELLLPVLSDSKDQKSL
jgi:hypothetical protein